MSLLIFDLDGTLIDSRGDLVQAVNATRAEMDRGPLPSDQIAAYVGDGASMLIRRSLGPNTPEDELRHALEFFLDYYRQHALDSTTLYPGVAESLPRLEAAGHRLAILTNKPVRISRAILDGLGVASHFSQVYGGNSFEHKKPHRIGIDTLRAELSMDAAMTWMIGDSYIDVQTARNAAVSACGVKWGFRPETFLEFPPDLLIETMTELEAAV
jgi:phosphoglycolate phosphatase